jgi:hypothetical protein
MKIALWLVAMSMVIPPALADEVASNKGVGLSTCGEFANAYRLAPAEAEWVFFSWAQGYMSAMNTAQSFPTTRPQPQLHDLNSMSTKDQERLIRAYCDEHPLGNYIDAVLKLYNTLTLIK